MLRSFFSIFFFTKNFIVSGLMFKFFNPFLVHLFVWCSKRALFYYFACCYPVFPRTINRGYAFSNLKKKKSKVYKKYSKPLIIRDMQTITIVRYHLTSVRMTFISEKIIYWQGCGERGTLVHCWWKYKLIQPLGKIHGSPFKIQNKTTI